MLPNLIIIGARKCGTTSLHHYLDQHPEIEMSSPKELNFFNNGEWRHRADWYRDRFSDDAPVRGEGTPGYSTYPLMPGVPERIHALIPEAKLIYLVGDPLERVVAQWVQWFSAEVDLAPESINARMAGQPLAEVLRDYESARNPYVCPSRYGTQLEQYLRFFPLDRILVLDQEDLRDRRSAAMREAFLFLGVDPSFTSEAFAAELNRGATKARPLAPYSRVRRRALALGAERVPRAIRAPFGRSLRRVFSRKVTRPSIDARILPGLSALLRDEVDHLRELTGKPFPNWSL